MGGVGVKDPGPATPPGGRGNFGQGMGVGSFGGHKGWLATVYQC